MKNRRFQRAKQTAVNIMSKIYDPLHDHFHVQEVEQTALKIYESLSLKERKKVDLEAVRLACLYHDTSRKVIKTNLLLQPFLDGYYSGKIAYQSLTVCGYSEVEAVRVREIINNHETILGLIKKMPDINGYLFSDSDFVEGYSAKRLDRAIKRFEKRQFSQLLFNFYVIALVMIHKKKIMPFHFKKTRDIYKVYIKELKSYIKVNNNRLKELLFGQVYNLLLSLDFLH